MAHRIAVFGAGSWGTALAITLAENGHDVALWARRPTAAAFMAAERHNPTYLPGAVIPRAVRVTAELEEAALDRDLWVVGTPSHAVRETALRIAPYASEELILVSVAKGIENETLLTTTEVLADVVTPVPRERIGVLFGPSHAEEVVERKPTAVVAAALSDEVSREIQQVFMTESLRIYTSRDLVGVEIAGCVKNVMAIAAGLSDGLGYGDNTKAAIVTRGLAEMTRLGLALGAEAPTFSGLAGLGDLVVTCFSRHSRNRHLGEQLGRGRTLEEAERAMSMVAEGVRTTRAVRDLARRHGIEMPITQAVFSILFEGKEPSEAVTELMTRSAKEEDRVPGSVP